MSDEKTTSLDENNVAESLLKRERGLLSEFQFSAPQPNTVGSQSIAIAQGIVVELASLSNATALHIDDITDRVWLTGTVGWTSDAAGTAITLSIRRDNPLLGTLIFTTTDTISVGGFSFTSSFSHVDFPVILIPGQTEVSYFLTAEAVDGDITITGPITLTGAEIERNRTCNP